jgi:hypothetical protein
MRHPNLGLFSPVQEEELSSSETFRFVMHIIYRERVMLNFQELCGSYATDVYRFAFWLAGDGFESRLALWLVLRAGSHFFQ